MDSEHETIIRLFDVPMSGARLIPSSVILAFSSRPWRSSLIIWAIGVCKAYMKPLILMDPVLLSPSRKEPYSGCPRIRSSSKPSKTTVSLTLITLVSFSPSFIVTVVKVLVFIDGVKLYVGRHSSTLREFTHAPALYN
jgi:hypothetical protein